MTPPDSTARLKEEAKALRARIDARVTETDASARRRRMACIYAGLITETLLEYEEPDAVMEQTFHRIADLLQTEPAAPGGETPLRADDMDRDSEIGRSLAHAAAKKLPRGLDDVHEIAIALIISTVPDWTAAGHDADDSLRLLVEAVIGALTFEMATQEFCEQLVDNFINASGHSAGDAILAAAAVAGHDLAEAQRRRMLPPDVEAGVLNVMIRESVKHGTPGSKDWAALAPANDSAVGKIGDFIAEIRPGMEDFFNLMGLEDPLARATAAAKTVGRLVAAVSVEDVGQIHPNTAKSLAKTGMTLGLQYTGHVSRQ